MSDKTTEALEFLFNAVVTRADDDHLARAVCRAEEALRQAMGWEPPVPMDEWRRRLQHAYHFHATFPVSPGVEHHADGTLNSDRDPLSGDFFISVRKVIADNMEPPRPPDAVVVRSLTRLT